MARAQLHVSVELLPEMLCPEKLVLGKGLPKDAKLVGVNMNHQRQIVVFYFEHPTFAANEILNVILTDQRHDMM